MAAAESPQRIDGVAGPAPAQFDVIRIKVGFGGAGEFEQRPTPLSARRGSGAVRRMGRQHQAHRAAEDFGSGAGGVQVAVVNGIEGAAKKSDQRWRISPLPKTTYFFVVRPCRPTGPRACSLSVEMPTSAPKPYSMPSAN